MTFTAGLFIRVLNVESAIDLLSATGFGEDDVSVWRGQEAFDALAGALAAAGIRKALAERCQQRVERGGMLVLVRCRDADGGRRAEEILARAGAIEIAAAAPPPC